MTTTASAADYHLQKAAEMLVDSQSCGIEYYNEDLRDELIKGGLDTGVTVDDAGKSAAAIAVALTSRIQSSVGVSAYCVTRAR